jgi:hypothetical protein
MMHGRQQQMAIPMTHASATQNTTKNTSFWNTARCERRKINTQTVSVRVEEKYPKINNRTRCERREEERETVGEKKRREGVR